MKQITQFFGILLTGILLWGCSNSDKPALAIHEQQYIQGIELAKGGDFTAAIHSFKTALSEMPGYSPADGSMAIAKDAEAGKLKPQAAMALFRAIDFGNHFDNEKKIRELNLAISIDPNYAPAYNERGIAFFDMGKFRQALSDRNQAIELSPNEPASYYNKALTCEKLEMFEDAIDAYARFIERANPRQKEHVEYARFRIEELEELVLQGRKNT